MTTKAPLASRWADDSDAVVAAVKQDKKIPKHRFAQKPVSRETNSRESENTQFSDQDVEEVSDSDWEDHVPVKSDKLSKDAHRLFPVGPAAKKDTKDTDKRRDRRKSSSTAELVESTRPKARESPKKKHRELPKELPKGPASSNSNNPLMSRIDSKWKAAPLQSKYAEPVQSKHADPKPSHKHQPLPKHKDRPRSDRAKKEPPLDPSFIQKQNALEFEKSLDKLKLESQTGNWADDLDWNTVDVVENKDKDDVEASVGTHDSKVSPTILSLHVSALQERVGVGHGAELTRICCVLIDQVATKLADVLAQVLAAGLTRNWCDGHQFNVRANDSSVTNTSGNNTGNPPC